MIRRLLLDRAPSPTDEWAFKWRNREVSRIEGLSDAVFGFAITLLIVSLEVPQSSGELLRAMSGFVSFAISFGFLFFVWKMQFTFFRRYPLEDNTTIFLTGTLLFFVLFFTYPLKFLMSTLLHVSAHDRVFSALIAPGDLVPVMEVYALGLTALLGTFALLYAHAYRNRSALGLDELESHDTRGAVAGSLAGAGIGVATAIVAPVLGIPKGSRWVVPGLIAYVGVITIASLGAALVGSSFKRERREIIARMTEERARTSGGD